MIMEKINLKAQSLFYNKIKEKPSYFKSVWEAIKPYVKGRVLDLGGNDGSLLDNYNGKEKYILDVAPKALQKAKRKGYQIKKAEMHKTGFKSNFFDTVLLIHTFEHSPKPFELLNELRRITKNEGIIIIEVPNASSLRQIINLIRGDSLPSGNSPLFLETPNHYFQYTSKTLEKTLRKAGFRNIKIIGKDPVGFPFNLLFKLIPNSIKKVLDTDIIAIVYNN